MYCQDCLVEGAELSATIKGLKQPPHSRVRAAWCAVIPGLGAVYNGEYLKALTYFAVWAALAALGNRVSGIFTFAAIVFVLFTIFDAYRSAETKLRQQLNTPSVAPAPWEDKSIVGWGVFLIVLGLFFLLQNVLPLEYLNKFWPLLFIILGAYLVCRTVRKDRASSAGEKTGQSRDGENI